MYGDNTGEKAFLFDIKPPSLVVNSEGFVRFGKSMHNSKSVLVDHFLLTDLVYLYARLICKLVLLHVVEVRGPQ